MRIKFKISIFLVIFLLTMGTVRAYETEMFSEIDFFQDEYVRNIIEPNLYDISQNPALYRIGYQNNFTIYKITGNRELNSYSRYFDPRQKNDLGLDLQWIKQLSRNSTLASGVKYQRSDRIKVTRSLEKNYYDHYFGLTDTTTGNVEYQGPKLWVLYNHEIANRFLLGIELDYGVERGLKNIYTECETILRDIDVNIGIGYHSNDGKTIAGLSSRYFNRQGTYEAVKDYEDAVVKTWFGYNLYYPENPRSTNRKNDDREGYKVGGQLEKKDILDTGIGIRFSGSYGQAKNTIEVGRPSYTQPRGYWEREGFQFTGNIYYQKKLIDGQLYFKYRSYSDWASPKDYDVLTIENDEQINKIGTFFKISPLAKLQLDLGFELSTLSTDYSEYAADFYYDKTNNNNFILAGFQYQLNQISDIHLHGNFGSYDADFHWPETDSFNTIGIEAGYKRQFLFGKLDFSVHYQKIDPDNINKSNEKFGISIYYIN